jgi:hypothetical protein
LNELDESILNQLEVNITRWCLDTCDGNEVWDSVKGYFESDFKAIMKTKDTKEGLAFLNDKSVDMSESTNSQASNFYEHTPNLKIQASTIHGVKGETHTATLYLETSYYGYDILRIIEYMKGNHKIIDKKRTIENLRVSYVGMSRPSHLLCVAVHKEHIRDHEKGLVDAGWQIDEELI